MTLMTCPRESELREVINRGEWPLAAEADLRAHAASCRSCSDFVLVSETLRNARASSTASARLVPPGILWWRAQLRRREAAVERIARPLLSAQIFALAFTLLAGVGFLVFEALTSDSWKTWFQALPQIATSRWDTLLASAAADPVWTWMMLGPALLLVGGVAVYMATDRQ